MPALKVTQNYLTPLEKWDEVKPYEIRGRIPPGLDRNNFDFTPYEVNIEDARSSTSEKTPCHVDGLNDSHSMLDKAGFTWVFNPLTDSLDSDANVDQHLASMKEFIVDYFKADLVSIFQYQIRKTLPDYKDPRVRPPSTFVHVDLSQSGAEVWIRRSCPANAAKILNTGRYRMVSLWRPMFTPLEDRPLGVCDSRTVDAEDLLESDYIYPTFVSESLVVKHSPRHRWYYLSKQSKDELLMIVNYDSGSSTRTPHCSFDLPTPKDPVRPRESIEIKAIIWTK